MKKIGSFVYFPCFLPELWCANYPKKDISDNFVQTSARNLTVLKQFTYVHLKVLITLFEKVTGVWATIHEILVIKISKKMLTQQKFNTIHRLQTLIFPTQTFITRPFRCISVNGLNILIIILFLAEVSTKLQKYNNVFSQCPN